MENDELLPRNPQICIDSGLGLLYRPGHWRDDCHLHTRVWKSQFGVFGWFVVVARSHSIVIWGCTPARNHIFEKNINGDLTKTCTKSQVLISDLKSAQKIQYKQLKPQRAPFKKNFKWDCSTVKGKELFSRNSPSQ